ncbi:MAG TPA: leucyl/phenylalanyl-tRNA--protein transferase [Abditibacteriaceae bacterium]|jgi:leucyl/phenylalanyl-tRNA--protein transferase
MNEAAYFPPVEMADEDGLLAVGGDLCLETLRTAYRSGIFPWPVEGLPLLWFSPPRRAVLFFDELYLGRRLRRALKNSGYEARVDANFSAVLDGCAAARKDDEGTWITPEMREAYLRLNAAPPNVGIRAHSVETYLNGELVGGLYGVAIGGYFCGESMFHRATNASRFALLHLIEKLQSGGSCWIDIQMMTPHFEELGAREIERSEFLCLMREAQGAESTAWTNECSAA